MDLKEVSIIKNLSSHIISAYSIGALLYTPATSRSVAGKIISGCFDMPYSLCLCLEDAIHANAVLDAQNNIIELFRQIDQKKTEISYLPKLFIRVRNPEQIQLIQANLGHTSYLLTGYVLPKFSLSNAFAYIEKIAALNRACKQTIYMMPILEGPELIPPNSRRKTLENLKALLSEYKEYILNIRVGGNDLCNFFSTRRNINETIYDIRPVADILSDIIATFFHDFIISGPVWEYFSGAQNLWQKGLKKELDLDLLNGFIGKTVIHPRQISVVNDALAVFRPNYEDALRILTHDNQTLQVEKNYSGSRMNEIKTHEHWAVRQLIRSYLYGVKEHA